MVFDQPFSLSMYVPNFALKSRKTHSQTELYVAESALEALVWYKLVLLVKLKNTLLGISRGSLGTVISFR